MCITKVKTSSREEWLKLCDWIETLPYVKELICG